MESHEYMSDRHRFHCEKSHEEAGQMEGDDQSGEDDRNRRAELDQNVQRRTGGILEGVTHGIPDNGRLVALGPLASKVALLNVLFCIIPGASGIAHKYGHSKTCDRDPAKESYDSLAAQDQSGEDGNNDCKKRGNDHLAKGAPGADSNTSGVVRIRSPFHDSLDLAELTPYLADYALGGYLDGAHGIGSEDKGQHGADKEADKYLGVGQREIHQLFPRGGELVVGNGDVRYQQGKRCQRGGSDGKTLAGSGRCVAERVQSVRALTNDFRKTGHLSDATRVVRHRTIGIGRQRDAQR